MSNYIELIESNLADKDGLEFIEQEIKLMFTAIANTNNINDAGFFFKGLEDVQFVLAKAIFKNGIEVTPFLRQFVYDFDRIDDKETKENLYSRIKKEVM